MLRLPLNCDLAKQSGKGEVAIFVRRWQVHPRTGAKSSGELEACLFVYWGLFAIIALGSLLNQEREPGRRRWLLIICASIPTILMIGLRWKIGPDWQGYREIFNYSKQFSFWDAAGHDDPGFFVLQWGLHGLDAPFWTENLICGLVFVTGLSVFCLRQPNPWLAYLVAFPYLVIVIGMSGNRQALALGFLFFALNAFSDQKIARFTALVLVAALFHGSALLMLPFCLLAYSENELQRAALLLVGAAIGYYLFRQTFMVYSQRYSMDRLQSSGVIYRLAMNAIPAAVFLLLERRFDLDDRQKRLWRVFSLASLAVGLLLIVVPSSTAVDRFALYLFPLQFVVLSHVPKVFSVDHKPASQMTLGVITYAMLVQLVFLQFGTFSSYYLPYRSIFSRSAF